MKGTRILMKAFLLGTSLLAFLSRVDAQDVSINVVSDKTWTVMDVNGNFLGNAQQVCLNATSPSRCPANATIYGQRQWNQWAEIPGATWIWSPMTAGPASRLITGTTSPADNAEFYFERTFYLCGSPQPGTISLSADNSAEVYLNGANTPVVTSVDWSVVTTANIPASNFNQGPNTIRIHVKNAPSSCTPDTYSCNPAGVVFGASFADALSAWPQCTNPNGNVGDIHPLSCPSGQTGSPFQICACYGSVAFWLGPFGSCTTPPPPTCTDNGVTFTVGQTETSQCTPPKTGTETRTCGANGWGSWNTSMCVTPPTCTDNGGTFPVGATETENCAGGFSGTQTRTCNAGGNWGSWNTSACQCPTGQLLCVKNQTKVCVIPQSGRLDRLGVMHSWCGNENIDCSNSCPADQECKHGTSILGDGSKLATTEEYCGGGTQGYVTGGGSDVALMTFLALMAVWGTAGILQLRKKVLG